MIFNSYHQIFKNPFAPHPEVDFIPWDIIEQKQTVVEKTFIEKTVINKDEPNIKADNLENKSVIPNNNSVSYEIRDITPKKLFWRK